MNKVIHTVFKELVSDRPLLLLTLVVAGLSIGYAIYVGLSLSPSDLQIATRYTAFGDTQYYRGKWYYFITFVIFAIIVGSAHIGIIAKLKARDMRPLALAFSWLSVILLIMFIILTHSILSVAFLS